MSVAQQPLIIPLVLQDIRQHRGFQMLPQPIREHVTHALRNPKALPQKYCRDLWDHLYKGAKLPHLARNVCEIDQHAIEQFLAQRNEAAQHRSQHRIGDPPSLQLPTRLLPNETVDPSALQHPQYSAVGPGVDQSNPLLAGLLRMPHGIFAPCYAPSP